MIHSRFGGAIARRIIREADHANIEFPSPGHGCRHCGGHARRGASGARADRIDGSWCNAEGDNPRIDGPKIVTLNMLQHFDEPMGMRLPNGTAQPWRRCEVRSNKLIRQSGALLNGRERHARPELTLHSKRKRGRLDAGGTAVPGNALENRPSAMCRVHGGNVQSVCFAILKEISRYGLSTVEADSPPEFP